MDERLEPSHRAAWRDAPRKTPMGLFEAIYTRRSVRKFLATPIEFDKLIEVIKAASYAPCAGNLQNWKFLLETDPEKIKDLYHHTLEQEAFLTATAAIIVVAETEEAEKFYGMRGKRLYAIQNCAAAIQNMLLAAHALGLGAVWIGAFDENRVNDAYKIPSVARAQAIVLLGYPDETPAPRHMKDIWYLINFIRYGLKYHRAHLIVHDLSKEWARKGKQWRYQADAATKKLQERLGADEKEGVKGAVARKGKDFFKEAQANARKMLKGLKKEPKKRQKKRRR